MIYTDITLLTKNKKYKIVDKKTKNTICLGFFVNSKLNCGNIEIQLITFDNKFFWHLNNNKYQIEDIDNTINNNSIIAFDRSLFPTLKISHWKNFKENYYDFVLTTCFNHLYFFENTSVHNKSFSDTAILLLLTIKAGKIAYSKINELCEMLIKAYDIC